MKPYATINSKNSCGSDSLIFGSAEAEPHKETPL